MHADTLTDTWPTSGRHAGEAALTGTDLAELRMNLDTRATAARHAVEALGRAHNPPPSSARDHVDQGAWHVLSVDAALELALAFVMASRR